MLSCLAIFVFTDIFTSLRERIRGSKLLSFRNPQPLGITGTQESPQNVTAAMPHHVSSTIRAIFAVSAIIIPVSAST